MRNENPTLVILSPGFPAGETDSTCLPMQQALVRSLKESYPGLTIIVLAFQYPFIKSLYKWNKVEVISMNGREKGGLLRRLVWLRVRNKLKQVNQQHTVIGLLSFWCGECAFVGKRFAAKKGIPHYCWIMGQDARPGNKYVKRMKPEAGELVAISDFLQERFHRNYGILPERVIPPGISTALFSDNLFRREIDILGVGSLIPLKQFHIFLEIVEAIRKSFPALKTVICGKGPEKNNLHRQIREMQLENHVTLMGELPHTEVLQLMQRSRILLHPSSYEGFSGVCLEALYAGAQVISFQKAMQEVIPHWHIVSSMDEMKRKTLELLQPGAFSNEPVLYNRIENTAKMIMDLFGH